MAKIRNYSLVLTDHMAGKDPISIRFLGDISFNDAYIDILESGKDPFFRIKPILKDADLVVGNLECLAAGTGQNLQKKPRIKTTEKALDTLKDLNLGLVTLATNHYYDNLEEGFDRTVAKLEKLGVAHVGATKLKNELNKPFVFDEKGWRIGFLNYVHPDTNPKVPEGAKVYANIFEMNQILEDIKKLKSSVDRVVILLHWGGKSDYGYFPHKEQIVQAKRMVDAGADAIIGHHTHTFQASISYKGRPIFFSLGNFCFADIHSDGGVYSVRNSGKKGGVVELKFFDQNKMEEKVIPFRIDELNLVPAPQLKREFENWKHLFGLIRSIPGLYSIYYYTLKRWEPVHFHAELNNTSIFGLAILKLKRTFGLG